MNMPGFITDSALYNTSSHYRAMAGTPEAAAAVTFALDTATDGTPIVDCNTFPDSITCHECNSTGPGTFECCQLGHPTGGCIVLNDPNYPGKPVPPTRWWIGSVGAHSFRIRA